MATEYVLNKRGLSQEQRKANMEQTLTDLTSKREKALKGLQEERSRRADKRTEMKAEIVKREDIQYVLHCT
jgi:hypothetical protein